MALAPDYYWRKARRTELGYSAEERADGLVLMRAETHLQPGACGSRHDAVAVAECA
ncbi:hypothetical protein ACGFOU_36155 [Streptomyces sp. NPDC048595]|uniref:hypothetical protein n=1 Tax=Streptomyces sp. NPDC048595 TaxID=3365576 RepID=UPI003720B386